MPADDKLLQELDEGMHKYLIYTLGGELYGSPLMGIREVIKLRDIKAVPHMVPHFRGVINLRGQIISVVDLRTKFGIKVDRSDAGLIVIAEGAHGSIGLIVDDLHSVKLIEPNQIDKNPALETKLPFDFFLGIAKVNNELINLLKIGECISAEEFRTLKRSA